GGSSSSITCSERPRRASVPLPAARTLPTHAASENAPTMYRSPPRVTIDTGVLRGRPLRRPRTVSRCWEPIARPRRRTDALSRTSHAGGGFGPDGTFMNRPRSPFRPALVDVYALEHAEGQGEPEQ